MNKEMKILYVEQYAILFNMLLHINVPANSQMRVFILLFLFLFFIMDSSIINI